MLIKTSDRPVYFTCRSCGSTQKLGSSCKCGGVQTHTDKHGMTFIEEDEKNLAVVDTE